MELSGQLHASAALPPEKEPPVTIGAIPTEGGLLIHNVVLAGSGNVRDRHDSYTTYIKV
jgi:hypothetical protein